MSKSLILPQRFAKKSQQKQEKSQETPILEKLPEPTGWRILVLPYKGKGKTEGGVFIPDAAVEREALATVCALVLKVGPLVTKIPKNSEKVEHGVRNKTGLSLEDTQEVVLE